MNVMDNAIIYMTCYVVNVTMWYLNMTAKYVMSVSCECGKYDSLPWVNSQIWFKHHILNIVLFHSPYLHREQDGVRVQVPCDLVHEVCVRPLVRVIEHCETQPSLGNKTQSVRTGNMSINTGEGMG